MVTSDIINTIDITRRPDLHRTFSPNKGNNMNDIQSNMGEAHEVLEHMVELVDENGNPTGVYATVTDRPAGDGEASQEGTAFVASDADDHEVTVH